MEGKDNRDTLSQMYDDMNGQCIRQPQNIEGVDCKIVFWGGGDMLYISWVLGLGGRFGGKGSACPWCEVDRSQLSTAYKEDCTLRTLDRLYMHSHTPKLDPETGSHMYPFSCDVCGSKFATCEVCHVTQT